MFCMTDSQDICPRLIDYIAIVSRLFQPRFKHIQSQNPQILKCYPSKCHEDFALPKDVVYFCQPDGCISSTKSATLIDTSTFVFTLTDKDADKTRFGISLNFYRTCEQSDPCSSETTSPSTQQIEELSQCMQSETFTDRDLNGRTLLTSICLISHHPFFSKFRQCLHILKDIIDRYEKYFAQAGLSTSLWSILLDQKSPQSPNSNIVMLNAVNEIESLLIRLLNTPVPVPGKTCVKLSILPENQQEPLLFALPDKTRLTLVDFPLHLPLELLGVETCLKVLTAIMLEQKVVLQSRDYNSLTMSVMAFTAMLYPLQYMFPAIPLLPTSLDGGENLLLSPTPFLIGIPATFLSRKSDFRFPADVWLVDLDTNRMMGSSVIEPVPTIPEQEGRELYRHLKQALASMRPYQPDPSSVSDEHENQTSNSILVNDVDSVDVATRVAMVRFFNSPNVLANFSEHTRTIRLFPRPVVAFQTASFLKSRQILTPFTRKLAQTQAVEFLAEWCLYPENEVFQRIHTGIHDPELIGDKAKWYHHNLAHIYFPIWSDHWYPILTAILSSSDTEMHKLELTRTPTTFDPYSLYHPPSKYEDLFEGAIAPQQTRSDRPKTRPNQIHDNEQDLVQSNLNYGTEIQTYPTEVLLKSGDQVPSDDSSSDDLSDQDDADIWDLKKEDPIVSKNDQTSDQLEELTLVQRPIDADTGESKPMQFPPAHVFPNGRVQIKNDSSGSNPTTRDSPAHLLQKPLSELKSLGKELFSLKSDDNESKSQIDPTKPKAEKAHDNGDDDEQDDEDEDDMEQTSVGKYLLTNLSDNLADAASHASSTLTGFLNKQKKIVSKSGKIARRIATEVKTGTKSDGTKSTDSVGLSTIKLGFPLSKSPLFKFTRNKSRDANADIPDRPNDSQHSSSDQEFLRSVVQLVGNGQSIDLVISTRLRELLLDENYRAYLMSKLNQSQFEPFDDPEAVVSDVSLPSMNIYKSYISLLRYMVRGLEQTCSNHGIGGLASAMMFLEICHTHYIDPKESEPSNQHLGDKKDVRLSKQTDEADLRRSSKQNDENLVDTFTGWLKSTTKDVKNQIKPGSPNSTNHNPNWTDRMVGLFGRNNPSSVTESNPHKPGSVVQESTSHKNRKSSGSRQSVSSERDSGHYSMEQSLHSLSTSPMNSEYPYWIRKTRMSSAFRFVNGHLVQCGAGSDSVHTLQQQSGNNLTKMVNSNIEPSRIYLFEFLIKTNERSRLWDYMQFWDDVFFDTVAQERDILGMDQAPIEMLERFANMNSIHKKMLQLHEDRLLTICLHNLIAYMILMHVDKSTIRIRVRRNLARCRLSSHFASVISKLLDELQYLDGNAVDLLPPLSRIPQFQSFEVRKIGDSDKEVGILEIYPKYLLIRNLTGEVVHKWEIRNLQNLDCISDGTVLRFVVQPPDTQVMDLQYQSNKAQQIHDAIQTLFEKESPEKSL